MSEASQQPEEAESASSARKKLFLGGLSWEATEDGIRSYFEQFGEVTEVIIMRERGTDRPRGFGFVSFKDQEAADRVVAHPEQHLLNGRPIDAKPSVPPDQKPKIRKIFVGGLAPTTTPEQFQDYFEQFGKVVDAQIMQDHSSQRSRGFGFITFEHEDSVDAVFAHGSMHELGGKRVEVKTATPKGTGSLRQATLPRGGPVMVPHGMARPPLPGAYAAAPAYPPPQVGFPAEAYAPLGVFAPPGAAPPGVVAGYPAPAYPYGPYSHAMMPPYYAPPYAGAGQPQGRGAGRAASPQLVPAVLPPGGGVYGMQGVMLPPGAAVPPGAAPQQQTDEQRGCPQILQDIAPDNILRRAH